MEGIKMNAIDFLIKEHNRVRKMLQNINDGSYHYATQKKQFRLLAQDLLRHETMEHQVWYPHFKDKLPSEVRHLLTEEQHAEKAIKKMADLKSEEAWKKEFLKFKSDVEHHANEEETELFPEVEKLLSEKELEQIGLEMFDFKMHYH